MIVVEQMSIGWLRVISVFLYFGYLLVPGYLVIRLASLKDQRVIVCFAISFSILIISQIPYKLIGGSVFAWYGWLHAVWAITLVAAFLLRSLRRKHLLGDVSRKQSELQMERVGLVLTGVGFAAYHLFVGPYTEIPSDFWAHLGRVVDQQYLIREGIYSIGEGFSNFA